MFWVKVRMDLEDEPTEFIFINIYFPFVCFTTSRHRCDSDKGVQHFTNPEIIDGTSKEHRCDFSIQVFIGIQFSINSLEEFNILP